MLLQAWGYKLTDAADVTFSKKTHFLSRRSIRGRRTVSASIAALLPLMGPFIWTSSWFICFTQSSITGLKLDDATKQMFTWFAFRNIFYAAAKFYLRKCELTLIEKEIFAQQSQFNNVITEHEAQKELKAVTVFVYYYLSSPVVQFL